MRILLLILVTVITTSFSAEPSKVPGQLIDMGGFNLHFIDNHPKNKPVVLFVHGMGGSAEEWQQVSELLDCCRTIAIDLHGSGFSDFGSLNHTLYQQVFDVHRLLEKVDINGQLIIVGQSFGGLFALEFAKRYPDQVAGMVLVDSSHPDMLLRYRNKDGSRSWQKSRERVREGVEIPEPSMPVIDPNREMISPEIPQPKGLNTYNNYVLAKMYEEWDSYHLGVKPLAVISAEGGSPEGDGKMSSEALDAHDLKLKQSLYGLSTQALFMRLSEGSHKLHLSEPETVADSVNWVIRTLKRES